MSEKLTYRELRTALTMIEERWPTIGGLPEFTAVRALLPTTDAELDKRLGEAVLRAAAVLDAAIRRNPPCTGPVPISYPQCGELFASLLGVGAMVSGASSH